MNNKISIIVPVYNLEQYIQRTIQSICDQSYTDLEIIIVDDGSEDQSLKIVRDLEKMDSRIIVIAKENGGVTSARITGLKAASGDWIGFVDGDDTIEVDMYERLLKNGINENAAISHCGYQMVFPNRIDYYYNSGKKCIQDNETGLIDLLNGDFVEPGLCNKLFRRDVINRFLNANKMDLSIKNTEDLLMNYYLFKEADLSVYEDFCPYHYMIRKNSAATSNYNKNKLEDPIKVLNTIMKDSAYEAVTKIAKIRLLSYMVYLSTISDSLQSELVKIYRKYAVKYVRASFSEVFKTPYSKKMRIQVAGVSLFPALYRFVHKQYARIKGTDKKYIVSE